MLLYIMLFACVIKIVEPTPILPEHYEIVHHPPPERVIIERRITVNKNARRVVRKPAKKSKVRPKSRPKMKKHKPKLKLKKHYIGPKHKKRTKIVLPKKDEE